MLPRGSVAAHAHVEANDPESERLRQDAARSVNWKRWGPYLSERQWGTVREDYSPDGSSWTYFTHDQSRSRAYRWGEDGLLGITDRECRVCFSLALWNGHDPFLKERLFGLTNNEGNHGEDVKEHYFYLDSTPTHSYLKALYKYPQTEFPYAQLIEENRRRNKHSPEFEISDTGVFKDQRYFDVFAEYAKADANDILIRITVFNRGPEPALLHLLPTIWFRNNWSWGVEPTFEKPKSHLWRSGTDTILLKHATLGSFQLKADPSLLMDTGPELIFAENDTNTERIFRIKNAAAYVKDAFHDYVVNGRREAVNPEQSGTKAAACYRLTIPTGGSAVINLRLASEDDVSARPSVQSEAVFAQRIAEADAFYALRMPPGMPELNRLVARQAYAGLCWSKQFYYYVVKQWNDGDPGQPAPPLERNGLRNGEWRHLYNRDVVSMPDKWEFPWYASWDLAFHMVAFARIDPDFAKNQLILLLREWYMHPNGQLPAYEYNFSDVNPPVHAWACWRVYKMSGPRGKRDHAFLARVFQKLLINFTWWVNRKDPNGNNLFNGGFLGLDNIGVFDRSKALPAGAQLAQADGTAWMAFYCSTMLSMALELAVEYPSHEDIASKFFEHFVAIADSINTFGGTGLWHDEDGFYYDQLSLNGNTIPMRIRSLVGLIPLLAVGSMDGEALDSFPDFRKRLNWFLKHRPDLARNISYLEVNPEGQTCCTDSIKSRSRHLLAIPTRERLTRILRYVLDENEFLSPYGIRSLSRVHEKQPFDLPLFGEEHRVQYVPGESDSALFGGNSNWRGPVWMPINYLIIEALERYHHFYGGQFTVECPTGSGTHLTLKQVATELIARLSRLFLPGADDIRPSLKSDSSFSRDANFKNLVLFHEYFHGDDGRGLGASHQTGWTALAAILMEQSNAK